ncbi:MAG: hypothetical protein PHH73_00085 [Candidatus Rickettsiella isopodorum]|nr:hypothetical protein [Candidatus Rickettsiella isopodorum]
MNQLKSIELKEEGKKLVIIIRDGDGAKKLTYGIDEDGKIILLSTKVGTIAPPQDEQITFEGD